MARELLVALAGQPNVGKSTVFNALTGQAQYVSNWPGKTSEEKRGVCRFDGAAFEVVDLPGVYSLTANTAEERLVRNFLIRQRPEVVVVTANAATLEHNLYLLAEVIALPVRVVLVLNMMDLAAQQGMRIEAHVLEAALGVPVVPMSASHGQGIQELAAAILRAAGQPVKAGPNDCGGEVQPENRTGVDYFAAGAAYFAADHRAVLAQLCELIGADLPEEFSPAREPALETDPDLTARALREWLALKLLEGDSQVTDSMQAQLGERWAAVHAVLMRHEDAILSIASGRYEWIGRMLRAAVVQPRAGQLTLTDRIDRVATHPLWGLLTLLGILGLLFWLTYALGTPLQTWLDRRLVQAGSDWVWAAFASGALAGAPAWLPDLLVHGVVAGVGTVLTLLPVLLIFFAALSLLEDVGYMARAAYVMDRFMHLMGLHGQSFLPLFLGFGCNVPAVMGARIVDSPKARLVTILVTPLVPCTARMAVITLLAPIFFGSRALWVSWGLVALSILALTLVGVVLHEFFLGGEHKAFIMEMPLYHFPNLRTIGQSIWGRLVDFLQMAGTIILVVSIVLWALSHFPGGSIEASYLAGVGRWLSPLGAWMGLDWRMLVALLASFVRKENTIPTLAVLYGVGAQGGAPASLAGVLSGSLAPAAALAFLAVQILFIPCMATLATIRQETGSWRWTITSVALLLLLSFSVGTAIYQAAGWLGWGV
ncbi:MAG: ferrous iron transport protein B [Chloroflexota bacterium]